MRGILNNIGPPVGVEEGVIVASPSKGNVEGEPDYFVSTPTVDTPAPECAKFRTIKYAAIYIYATSRLSS
jgi:hypothetical protein